MRIILAIFALVSASSAVLAQPAGKTPEYLLPGDCLAYFRYDGFEPHRKAYEQTALAKAMKEGLGDFFDHAFGQIASLTSGDLLRGNLKQIKPPPPEVDRFVACLSRHGFALAFEAAKARRGQADPEMLYQMTIVFPEGAEKKNRKALEDFFRLLAGAADIPVTAAKHGGRPGHAVTIGNFEAAWWVEGQHMLLTFGDEPAKRALAVIEGRRANLTTTAWYRELAGFSRYETDMRGHLNLETLVDQLALAGLEPPKLSNVKDHLARQVLLRHLGLTGLKNFSFHLGFDGKYQRSTVRLGVVETEKRSGLLTLLTAGPIAFDPAKLPPLPPDADYVSVRHIDWNDVYSYIRSSYSLFAVSQLFNGELPQRFPDLDNLLGIDFRADFLDQLDTSVVTYGAHSEGPFFIGQGFAVKVKDAAKVRKSLAAITKKLGAADEKLAAQKKSYRGHDMYVFNRLYLPVTFAVHNDWLVFGLFPQSVQGFIMRSGGQYRTWKAPPELQEVLAKARKENEKGKLLAMSVSDPRPVVEVGLALMPAWIQMLNQGAGADILDISKIPNAQSVNEWLFPNVMLSYDDGNAIRWENHYSINEPDDLIMLQFLPLAPAMFGIPLDRPRWNAPPQVGMPPPPGALPPAFPGAPPPPPFPGALPPPIPELPAPTMCPATAVEEDGKVVIRVTVTRQVAYTVTKRVPYTVTKEEVTKAGEKRKVTSTTYRDVTETAHKPVAERQVLIADGKNLRVTRKDCKAVEPRELLTLLEKETQVLLVTKGEIDAEGLRQLDERTLIIRVTPPGPEAITPTPVEIIPSLPKLPSK